MKIVTLSRQHGSAGHVVGLKVAEALGYRHLDKEIILHAAREAGIPTTDVARFDENPDHPFVRALKRVLIPGLSQKAYLAASGQAKGENAQVPHSELPSLDEDAYVRLTREAIVGLAQEGEVVVLGRGGQAILADRPEALHVRIIAPLELRCERVADRQGIGTKEAREEIQKADTLRELYIRRHYRLDWEAPEHYHLIINTGRTGAEGAVQTIVDAALHLQPKGASPEKP